ncbi:MAG: divergent PAP2 family protein [Oscillospiraceae bacterium]|nr:divergent PAP2 family protein [Oscillospiraceae bacterium]
MFYNPILCAGILGWASAQILKFILHFFQNASFNPERLYGSGGMPSSHSSLVCATMISCGRVEGFTSTAFALAFVFGVIVMYDAAGVRYAAGLHAKELNLIRDILFKKEENLENKKKEFKEFLGHTPLQVFCGALLGVLIGVLIPLQ